MKLHLIAVVFLLGIVGAAFGQNPAVPKVISDGFVTYKEIGAAKAVDAWLAGSLLANDARGKSSLVASLKSFEAINGSFSGYESIGAVTLSPSVRYCYIVLLYDNAPLYASFEVYATGGKDIVTAYRIDPHADQIVPASFFEKSRSEKESALPHDAN
jgi:hypothetical protein